MEQNPYEAPESRPPPGKPFNLLGCVLYSVVIGFLLGVSLLVALLVMCGGNLSAP
jgi:hypothetical protein